MIDQSTKKGREQHTAFYQEKVSLLVENISKNYDTFKVIDNISFEVRTGETLAIIGPSGCGKSTLLYMLAGLDTPNTGTILFQDGIPSQQKNSFFQKHERSPRISYVMQDYGLFPWKTAEDNLALPLLLAKYPKKSREELVENMLTELNLENIHKKYPFELSGGQRQRLALGRALINSPEILLLDEPLSSVDAITRENLQRLIFDLWKKYCFTCVLVTHSISEAIFLGKNIMVLKKVQNNSSEQTGQLVLMQNPCFGDESVRHSPTYAILYKNISQALANA